MKPLTYERAFKEGRPIDHWLDLDMYKLTMGYEAFLNYPNLQVECSFINRSKYNRLANVMPERALTDALDHAFAVQPTKEEIDYILSLRIDGEPMFTQAYADHLLQIPKPQYSISVADGQYEITYRGFWKDIIYMENRLLATVSQLHYEHLLQKPGLERDAIFLDGARRAEEKLRWFDQHRYLSFINFGQRRRFCRSFEEELNLEFRNRLEPTQFLGCANVHLARIHNVTAMGTSAHERDMVKAALLSGDDYTMASAKRLSILDWIALYGEPLSIILADTFGHKATFDAINRELARIIRGFRQDSGPPVEFGEQAIRFFAYRGLTKEEIANKMIIFSDSLNLEKMLDIYLKMAGRIRSTFGVGTYLTNDMGLPALNIVAKLIAVLVDGEWVPTVKLSADRGKNLGPDDLVERYKRVFKYDEPLGF